MEVETKDQAPALERQDTDQSLRQERDKTDNELDRTRNRLEGMADALVDEARQETDDALRGARAETQGGMEGAAATTVVRDIAMAAQATEQASLVAERVKADAHLEQEREKSGRTITALLAHERSETDYWLLLERAHSDRELKRVLAELAEVMRCRDEFFNMVGHEIRTPLTPVTLRLQALAKEASRQPDSPFARRVNDYLLTANRRMGKLSALVADMLDVSRLASEQITLHLEAIDFGGIVREVVAHYGAEAAKAGCALQVDAPGVVGRWDELRLEQVMSSLIDNAIKFGPGKPIRVCLEPLLGSARLTVQDYGIGIDSAHIERIFGRFERAVPSRSYGGLGLGLYLSRNIANALGGSIDVQSEPGHGSTFTVDLPLLGPHGGDAGHTGAAH